MYHTIIPLRTTFHNTIWHCMISHVALHHIAHSLHCTLFHITATYCITAHHHIPHVPHHHSTSHYISQHHLTLHDITCSITPYRTYSTLHFIPHNGHIWMNKAQYPTSGIAKQIPHHTMAASRGDVWSGGIKCVEWCEIWYGVIFRKMSRVGCEVY